MKSLQQCIHIYVSQLLISAPKTGGAVPEESGAVPEADGAPPETGREVKSWWICS